MILEPYFAIVLFLQHTHASRESGTWPQSTAVRANMAAQAASLNQSKCVTHCVCGPEIVSVEQVKGCGRSASNEIWIATKRTVEVCTHYKHALGAKGS